MSDNTEASTEGVETTPEVKKPFLTVVKGNPDDVQVATLTALFATMASNAAGAGQQERERNMWGSVEERLQRPTTYNPTAFQNVSFY
ncbi:MAG: acyl-CoA carboxylase subunit epsilon [Corynebacterium sp.]|uniref:acyl-CoA carboxylase subunit epsilon n=1 Tax=Corynebacterium sp. TaxID=1720 RepID=UPI0026DD8644|nr:acyl-CoA carboxylase subunit epsilon [Corynebacterium sp.]MDO5097641.1 acyl-CoA carboxylase subunit epsilon [Corynebacterium sp.]